MVQRPVVWCTICYVAGSSAAAALRMEGIILGLAALLALLSALAWLRLLPWRVAAVCALAYGVAAGSRIWADAANTSGLPEWLAAAEADESLSYAIEAIGTITQPVSVDGDRAQFRMKLEWLTASDDTEPVAIEDRLQVQVKLAEQAEQELAATWRRGDRVRLNGELRLPAEASNFDGFDYRRYLHSQRIHWLLQVDGAGAVTAEPGGFWTRSAWMGRVDAVREAMGARMDAMYPEQQAGYMKGLVMGMSDDLDPERFRQFSELGLTHILAISGLHVAVFLYCLHLLLRMFRLPRETAMNILIAAVPLYVLLSGASPSVIRAGIMSMIGLFAAKLGMLKDGLHLLCAAALLMLIIEPYMLGNVSFQMSVIVTGGLIVGVQPLRKSLPQLPRGKAVIDLVAVSVAAQLASFPLTIYYFNQFNLVSLPANILLVPFISSIVMPLGAVSLALTTVWQPAANLVASLAKLGNDLTFTITDLMNQPDVLRSSWPTPPLWWVLAWYAALLLLYRCLPAFRGAEGIAPKGNPLTGTSAEAPTVPLGSQALPGDSSAPQLRKWRVQWLSGPVARLAGILLLNASLLGYAYAPNRWDHAAYVEMIDVGQGDALLIRTPEGRHILVDGGGTVKFRQPGEEWRERREPYEVGRKLLVPLLMKRGVHKIDLLIVSHLDTDHIGGLAAVLDTIPVKRMLWNGSYKESTEAKSLLAKAVQRGVVLYPACAPQEWQLEPQAKVKVLWPPAAGAASCGADVDRLPVVNEQNEYSVVARIELYGYSLLLTGDIGTTAERLVLQRLTEQTQGHPQVDIMKVAHHGSRHSTTQEWVNYWQPAAALIPVGRYNWYGHPHPTVTGRLEDAGTVVLRSDRDGGVLFRMTEHGIEHRAKLYP
ncbi:ComEC/Rec2 family competence protein [Paenibacillus daejeonensis]|uniref:ComEC/Rec2 family competence protein n=1 Tax=Paenibacillus daejeonensis TaxID=135193 RepID=UPI000364F691|nr:ComEC/Rec2 family competence protein [Paenibacillus daejeonensis]